MNTCDFCAAELKDLLEDEIVRDREGNAFLHKDCAWKINEAEIPSKTKEELSVLAFDIHNGVVFSTFNFTVEETVHNLSNVFLPIESLPSYKLKQIGLIYEYITQASPKFVNGYPTFHSFRLLNIQDTKYLIERLKRFEESKQKALCS